MVQHSYGVKIPLWMIAERYSVWRGKLEKFTITTAHVREERDNSQKLMYGQSIVIDTLRKWSTI